MLIGEKNKTIEHCFVLLCYTLITIFVFSSIFYRGVCSNVLGWYEDFVGSLHQSFAFTENISKFQNPYGFGGLSDLLYQNQPSVPFLALSPLKEFYSFLLFKVFDNLILVQNILILSTFPLSGFGAYLLCKYFIGHRSGSFVGGIIYAFSSYHVYSVYLHLASIEYLPFQLLYMFKFKNKPSLKNSLFCAFFTILNATTSIYYLIYLCLLPYFIFLIFFIVRKEFNKKHLKNLLPVHLMTFCVIYLVWCQYIFLPKDVAENAVQVAQNDFSTDIPLLLLPSMKHPTLSLFTRQLPLPFIYKVTSLFLGYIVLILSIAAIINVYKNRKTSNNDIKFMVYFAIISFILALGPRINILGFKFGILPYSLFGYFPFINALRSPGRIIIITTLCLSVLTAISLKHVFTVRNLRVKYILVFIFSIGILFELCFEYPYTTLKLHIPKFYYNLAKEKDDYSIVELPFHEMEYYYYFYYQSYHKKKLIHGITARAGTYNNLFIENTPLLDFLFCGKQDSLHTQTLYTRFWPLSSTRKIFTENIDNAMVLDCSLYVEPFDNYRNWSYVHDYKNILKSYNIKYIILHKVSSAGINFNNYHLLNSYLNKMLGKNCLYYKDKEVIVYKLF